jgi:hypothetical protein
MFIFKLFPQMSAFLLAIFLIIPSVYAETEIKARNDQEIVELQPEDFKPAFTEETVLKLNAIVRKSLEVIREYTNNIKNIRATIEQATQASASDEAKSIAQKNVDTLGKLSKRSKDALAEMTTAATELKNSDELFNPTLLHGMVDFVEDVEREITSEYNELSSLYSSQLD